eukprot:1140399-Pelagomonas_calceolata.AAC.3
MKSGALASVPGSMLFTPVCDLFKLTDLPHPTILVSKRCVIHDISVLALHCAMATLPIQEYVKRLAGVFVFFYAFVGGPISYQTFDPFSQGLVTVRMPGMYHVMSQPGSLSCHVMSCHNPGFLSCHVMSQPGFLVMSCHVTTRVSCHAMSCHNPGFLSRHVTTRVYCHVTASVSGTGARGGWGGWGFTNSQGK